MIATPESIAEELHWYALCTRSRHEKKVSNDLQDKHLEQFLPLTRVLSQWADRKKWVEKPYFPGYLFVRIHTLQIPEVYKIQGVARFVTEGPYTPAVISDAEIENIQRLVSAQVQVDPYPYLKPGQTVCIRRGPLRGVEGTIIRKSKKHLLVVSVKLLGSSVAAEVAADCVQGL